LNHIRRHSRSIPRKAQRTVTEQRPPRFQISCFVSTSAEELTTLCQRSEGPNKDPADIWRRSTVTLAALYRQYPGRDVAPVAGPPIPFDGAGPAKDETAAPQFYCLCVFKISSYSQQLIARSAQLSLHQLGNYSGDTSPYPVAAAALFSWSIRTTA
jgi:hypothetical protein